MAKRKLDPEPEVQPPREPCACLHRSRAVAAEIVGELRERRRARAMGIKGLTEVTADEALMEIVERLEAMECACAE